jgi:Zn-dependent protease with chaperone function
MQTNAIYRFNDEEQKATVSFLKNKLSILLENKREVFWYYEQIKREQVYTFKYAEYPLQTIQLSSSSLADELEMRITKGSKAVNVGKMAPLLKLLLFFFAFLLLAWLFLVPWIASALAGRFPISYEKSIGDQTFNAMKADFVVDEKRTAYVNEFFDQMKISSRYDVQIFVVKGDLVNAFALPGGRIVVYDQLINKLDSYPELAAMLTHEFTHVENRHTIKTLFRQLGSKVFLSLVFGDATAVGGVVISNADELKSLSYSRSLEKEADENGARLLADRKIDCNGFVRLFTLLKKETPANSENAEWISSHPNLDKRIKNIEDHPFCQGSLSKMDSTLHSLFLKVKTENKEW